MSIKPGRTPKSAILVLGTLAKDGPMCPNEISEKLNMAPRTVSFAIRSLLGWKMLRRIPNLTDMRCPKYHVNMDLAKGLLQKYNDSIFTSQPSAMSWNRKI
ncbi:MAG: MarR family transcriptional regulator [Candidatus Thorarchaeota archaeon]|nr:MarR family transcriptional regulator [Candidatus Thorarchaeota archaeon]